MNLRGTINEYINQGEKLLDQFDSVEHVMLTGAELHILRVQLHLLDSKAAELQNLLYAQSKGLTDDPDLAEPSLFDLPVQRAL